MRDGHDTLCKACKRTYYRDNIDRISELNNVARLRNRDRIREAERNRWRDNDELRQKKSQYHFERNNTLDGRARLLLYTAKIRAQRKGWEFNLTEDWVRSILARGICQMTGIPFQYINQQGTHLNPFTPSIDRKNNSCGGYTIENCQIVVDMYNRGKGQNSDEVFLEFCRSLIRTQDALKHL